MTLLIADDRWVGRHGIGRFSREVLSRLKYQGVPESIPFLRPTEALHLTWWLWRKRPSIYFTPGFNPPLSNVAPTIFVLHDLIHLVVPEEASLVKSIYYNSVVKRAVHFSHRVLTVSEYSRQQIVAWANVSPSKVVVVGNGVSRSFSPEGECAELGFPYLFYIGNRKPHKNLFRLMEAFHQAQISGDVRLVVSGVADATWSKVVAALGLGDRVFFAGDIPEDDLPSYYRGALALVFPSLFEGFGLPVIEAMACGTPVLTSNTTSLPEVAGSAALYCDPLSVNSISTGIERIVGDRDARARFRILGLERARSFSWDDVFFRIKAELDSAIQ